MSEARTDPRIAYGAACTWWDTIYNVGKTEGFPSLPCCPHCGKMLLEMPDEAKFFSGIPSCEAASGETDYGDMVRWARGKCFPNVAAMRRAYEASK